MKKLTLIIWISLIALFSRAQEYTNWPPFMAPVANQFSAWWSLHATNPAAGLTLLGGNTNGGNGIQMLNGFGTNTTLRQGVYIGVTNLTVHGISYLNNSNMVISSPVLGGVIPSMTESNLPYGTALASTYTNSHFPWKAFSGTNGYWWDSGPGQSSAYVQYNLGTNYPITAVSASSHGTPSFGETVVFSYSTNGTSWVNLMTNSTGSTPSDVGWTSSVPLTAASYYKWTISSVGLQSYTLYNLQVFTNSIGINVISNTSSLVIFATNGVAINTNNPGTNALRILGDLDVIGNSKVSGTQTANIVNGASDVQIGGISVLSFIKNTQSGNQLVVTNATGTAANYNGTFNLVYGQNLGNPFPYTWSGFNYYPYYTNGYGWLIVPPGSVYGVWTNSAINSLYGFTTNVYLMVTNLFNGPTSSGIIAPSYYSSSLVGAYSPLLTSPAQTPYVNLIAAISSTANLLAGDGNGNAVNSGIQPASVVTTNSLANSTNRIYWIDCFATNAVSKMGSPLQPFLSIDGAAADAAGVQSLAYVSKGTYLTAGFLTNFSVIGSGVGQTLILDTNIPAVNSLSTATLFYVTTSSNTWKNFTLGFSYGGDANTNFGSPWYVPSGAPNITNTIENVSIPRQYAAFDGIVSLSTANETWMINNWSQTWDLPWDDFNFVSGGIKQLYLNGGTYIGNGITNSVNPNGNSHVIWMQTPSDGSGIWLNGVNLQATSPSNGYPVVIGGAAKILTFQMIGSTAKTASTNYSISLSSGTIGSGYNLKSTVAGSVFDTISMSTKWLASTNVVMNYSDWTGGLHLFGLGVSTNTVGTTVVGQMPITISNVVYYIDLKK